MTCRPLAAALLPTLALGACATVPRLDAANDVHALLVSIRDGDRPAFEAHVDRPALKTQLKSRLIAEAGRRGGDWGALGVSLIGPMVDVGVDVLVRPDVFRAQALRLGYDPNRPLPSPLVVAALVRPLGDGRACVRERRGGPCVLSFNQTAGTWRLAGYEGPINRLLGSGKAPGKPSAKPR